MASKKEIKTTQKSISMFEMDWQIVKESGSIYDTDSEKFRKIIRDYVFLRKVIKQYPDIYKKWIAFEVDTGLSHPNKQQINQNMTWDELMKIYPEIRNLEENLKI